MRATLRMRIGVLALALASANASASGTEAVKPAVQLRLANVDQDGWSIPVWLAVFDVRRVSVVVIDNAAGDNARFQTLKEAMEATGCLAGCNGNFFIRHPFAPVGLMISDGKQIGPIDPMSWMKGLLMNRGTRAALEPSDDFRPAPEITAALQSGPWLVRAARPEPDLDKQLRARRTFVCHNGDSLWALGACGPCTLDELSRMLRQPSMIVLLDIKFALNLDGGPSSGLWVSHSPGNFYLEEGWPVRNYVGLKPR